METDSFVSENSGYKRRFDVMTQLISRAALCPPGMDIDSLFTIFWQAYCLVCPLHVWLAHRCLTIEQRAKDPGPEPCLASVSSGR